MTTEPLVPLTHLALEIDITATDLAAQLAHQVLTDDLGRLAIDRRVARDMISAHQAQQRALADRQAKEAERQAIEQQRAQAQEAAQARARAERAARQQQLHQDNPGVSAIELMMLDSPDPDNRLAAAGRRFDDMLNAGRAGNFGTMYRFNPQQQEG